MNLFNVLKSALSGSHDKALTQINEWLEQQGGLNELLNKLRNHGLTSIVDSWTKEGENLPISTEQLTGSIEPEKITELSSKMGLDNAATLSILAKYLPDLVNHLTEHDKHFDLSKIDPESIKKAFETIKQRISNLKN